MSRIGWPPPGPQARRRHLPVERVVQNILADVQNLASSIHTRIFANPHGHEPNAILTALGEKATAVLELLKAAQVVNAPVAVPEVIIQDTPAVEVTSSATEPLAVVTSSVEVEVTASDAPTEP